MGVTFHGQIMTSSLFARNRLPGTHDHTQFASSGQYKPNTMLAWLLRLRSRRSLRVIESELERHNGFPHLNN